MKKNVKTLIMLVLFATTSVIAVAQKNETTIGAMPKWIFCFTIYKLHAHTPVINGNA